ncbi:DUF362 domain-containing protein [bacterium]|nr:DUF362 domain-containing protein [bacterium]
MKRRDFFKTAAGVAAATVFQPPKQLLAVDIPDLIIAEKGEPAALVQHAVNALGGMSRFVSRGDEVVIKANMSWDRVPKQAATTNPDVVAEVVKLCFESGARKVKLFDRTLNEPRRCYKRSGIQEAAEAVGADVQHVYDRKFKMVSIPEGILLKQWQIYDDVLEADKIINIPIAKHHSVGGASLGMKNFMGFLGGNRGSLHRDYPVKIVDINTKIKADLIILDAYRVLLRNGPSGGNLADVSEKKMLIAGTDPVAVDAYGMRFFNIDPETVRFLREAKSRGLGELDLSKKQIKTIQLSL